MVDATRAMSYSEPGSFTVGGVISQTIRVLFMAPGQFLALSIIPVLPLVVKELTVNDPRNTAATGAAFIVQMILAYIFQASMVYGSFMELRTGRFDVGEAISVGLKRFFPILGATLLTMLIIMVGMVLLIVPGFIAMSALLVVIPVCTIERLGPIESLQRSRLLTKGSRWSVFGAMLVIGLLTTLVVFLAAFAVTMLGGKLAGELASNVAQVLTTAINSVFAAVAYYQLRAQKEGVGIEAIANVFD